MTAGLLASEAIVFIFEDKGGEAESLRLELEHKGKVAEVYTDRAQLIARAREIKRGVFTVDIDHGPGKEEEGLTAMRELSQLRAEGRDFLILALTSHPEHEREASAVGANAFLRKLSVTTDALEVLTRSLAHDRVLIDRTGMSLERELASAEYARLRDIWLEVTRGGERHQLRAFVNDIQDGLTRALRWPFADRDERTILVAVERLVAQASISEDGQNRLEPFIAEGLDMLAQLHELSHDNLRAWLQALDDADAETHLRWLDEGDDE